MLQGDGCQLKLYLLAAHFVSVSFMHQVIKQGFLLQIVATTVKYPGKQQYTYVDNFALHSHHRTDSYKTSNTVTPVFLTL